MNIQRKEVKVIQCLECPATFMMVGSTPIGMAYPRPVSKEFKQGEIVPMTGTCPAHRKSLIND